MKLSATPSACTRRLRWKQHLRKKPYDEKLRKILLSQSVNKKALSTPKSITKLSTYFYKLHSFTRFKTKPIVTLNMPKHFCIFNDPEQVLVHCGKTFNTITRAKVHGVKVDHRKTKEYGLAPEVLFGLTIKEAQELRKRNNTKQFKIYGLGPNNQEHRGIITHVGIVSELGAEMTPPLSEREDYVHIYKADCLTYDSPSYTSQDTKNSTTIEVIRHIDECLSDHDLELKTEPKNLFKGYIAEILDNVEQHSGSTSPVWFVRSYLNNNTTNKILELSIFNFGLSFSETFLSLSDDNYSKKIVDKYVGRHKHKVDPNCLYTVAALQGRVSSKNKFETDNRGQGTVKLIELFEKFYSDYKKINNYNSDNLIAQMNLISGSTVIKFDGKYKSIKHENDLGFERVILSFNDSGDLSDPPDTNVVQKMKNAFFPGAMINIKLPLSCSINHIDKGANNDDDR